MKTTLLVITILLSVISTSQAQTFHLAPGFPPPDGGDNPYFMGIIHDKVILAMDDTVHGKELWEYDGTTLKLVKDIVPGPADGEINHYNHIIHNNICYFKAENAEGNEQIFMYDGTECSLVEHESGALYDYIKDFEVFKDTVYTSMHVPGYGTELHKIVDGKLVLVEDLRGESSANVKELFAFGSRLYFSVQDGKSNQNVYYYDGGKITLLHDPNRLTSASPHSFTSFGSKFLYSAMGYDEGREFFYYDTLTDSHGVYDINTGKPDSSPRVMADLDSVLIIRATHITTGSELYKIKGEEFELIADMNPEGNFDPQWPIMLNDELVFRGETPEYGKELYSFDGTSIKLITDYAPGAESSTPWKLIEFDDKIFFLAEKPEHGIEFCYYDGNSVQLYTDMNEGKNDFFSASQFVYKGNLYISAYVTGNENGAVYLYTLNETTPPTATVNPAKIEYKIADSEFTLTEVQKSIKVFDVSGRTITFCNECSSLQLPQNSGIFIVQIIGENGDINTLKFSK